MHYSGQDMNTFTCAGLWLMGSLKRAAGGKPSPEEQDNKVAFVAGLSYSIAF